MCSGERYLGSPRPGERLTTKMPLAASRSKSRTILARTSLGSGPFQLANGWMAPYSCGGDLKFAATSPRDGTVSCCQGRCANRAAADSGKRSSLIADFILFQSNSIIASEAGKPQFGNRVPFFAQYFNSSPRCSFGKVNSFQ